MPSLLCFCPFLIEPPPALLSDCPFCSSHRCLFLLARSPLSCRRGSAASCCHLFVWDAPSLCSKSPSFVRHTPSFYFNSLSFGCNRPSFDSKSLFFNRNTHSFDPKSHYLNRNTRFFDSKSHYLDRNTRSFDRNSHYLNRKSLSFDSKSRYLNRNTPSFDSNRLSEGLLLHHLFQHKIIIKEKGTDAALLAGYAAQIRAKRRWPARFALCYA